MHASEHAEVQKARRRPVKAKPLAFHDRATVIVSLATISDDAFHFCESHLTCLATCTQVATLKEAKTLASGLSLSFRRLRGRIPSLKADGRRAPPKRRGNASSAPKKE
jgi:hypothetical protein